MRKFQIRYGRFAIDDLNSSFAWGIENWGLELAEAWLAEIEDLIADRLSTIPASCPVAPESDELDVEVRQLVFGRYRVLFTIKGNDVLILRIRGPFNSSDAFNLEEV